MFTIIQCKKGLTPIQTERKITNIILFGDKDKVNVEKQFVLTTMNDSFTKFTYREKEHVDSVVFRRGNITYNNEKLEKIDSLAVSKKHTVYKLINKNKLDDTKIKVIFVNNKTGLVFIKTNFNDVCWFFDIDNNYDFFNDIENFVFAKDSLETMYDQKKNY